MLYFSRGLVRRPSKSPAPVDHATACKEVSYLPVPVSESRVDNIVIKVLGVYTI